MQDIVLKTAGNNKIIDTATVADGGVRLIGFINECRAHEGPNNWHSAVEAWDVRNEERPVFIHRIVVAPDDQYHNADVEATALVLGEFNRLVEQGNSPDLEPGEFIKILVDMEAKENETPDFSAMLRAFAAYLLLDELEGEFADDARADIDEDLPGAFSGFNPFLQ